MNEFLIPLGDRVTKHVAPSAWARLHDVKHTVITIDETGALYEQRFFDPERPAPVGKLTTVPCRFLGMLIVGKAAPDDTDCERFGRALMKLLELRLFVAHLGEPAALKVAREGLHEHMMWEFRNTFRDVAPDAIVINGKFTPRADDPEPALGRERCLLVAYLHSTKTNDELNAVLGFNGFIDEGHLPIEWPVE